MVSDAHESPAVPTSGLYRVCPLATLTLYRDTRKGLRFPDAYWLLPVPLSGDSTRTESHAAD